MIRKTHELPALIAEALSKPLPGAGVQWEMASSDRMKRDFPASRREESTLAAVLILLYPADNSIYTMLMQRPVYKGVHSGQISFPGGKAEPADQGLIETALREAAEETGINTTKVRILGLLTPLYIPVSDTEVTPVVGWCQHKPELAVNEAEVAGIIEVSLPRLNNNIIKEKPYMIRGEILNIRYYDYNGNVIWGATAMLLHELLTVLKSESISLTLED